ncbi:MAG: hypothetical protein ACRDX8_11925 [Acidimicrobiales bacterium]
MTSELYREIEAELAGVERALARLEDGTYGTCEACGQVIAQPVLLSSPTASRCPNHEDRAGPQPGSQA